MSTAYYGIMKFEIKTDEEQYSKRFFTLFLNFVIFSFIILIFNISFKLGNISRYYEINYYCNLLKIDKNPVNFKKLSNLFNKASKQKILDLCREIVN